MINILYGNKFFVSLNKNYIFKYFLVLPFLKIGWFFCVYIKMFIIVAHVFGKYTGGLCLTFFCFIFLLSPTI